MSPQRTLPRRRLLASALALPAVAVTAAAPALAAADPDAALLELGRQHDAIRARWLALSDRAAATHETLTARYPPQPETLRIRLSDHPISHLDLGARSVGEFMTFKDVERWRTNADMLWVLGLDQRQKKLARRGEILEAHDRWVAERERLFVASGLRDLEDTLDAEGLALTEIEKRIFAMRAHTPGGWRLKARVAHQIVGDEQDGTYEDHVLHSVLADLTAEDLPGG